MYLRIAKAVISVSTCGFLYDAGLKYGPLLTSGKKGYKRFNFNLMADGRKYEFQRIESVGYWESPYLGFSEDPREVLCLNPPGTADMAYKSRYAEVEVWGVEHGWEVISRINGLSKRPVARHLRIIRELSEEEYARVCGAKADQTLWNIYDNYYGGKYPSSLL